MDDWIAEFRPQLLSQDGVNVSTLAHILQRIARIDERDLQIAGTFTKVDLSYLREWQIWQVIEAEIDERQAQRYYAENKTRYTRIADLLPQVLHVISKKTTFGIRYTIDRIDSISHDFGVPSTYPRKDKALNDRVKRLTRTRKSVETFIEALSAIEDDHGFAGEYQDLVSSLHEMDRDMDGDLERGNPQSNHAKFETLLKNLQTAVSAINVVLLDLGSENPRNPLSDYNMRKSDVVSLAYDLHLTCGGPPLVTTPGSEFSNLCSVICEICTGEAEQSLAGAIISFSKSRERREADENETDIEDDEAAFQSGNNFHLIEKSRERSIRSAEWYLSAVRDNPIDKDTGNAMLARVRVLLKHVERLEGAYGPFIVWASQEPQFKTEEWRSKFSKEEERVREARILLGQTRRVASAKSM